MKKLHLYILLGWILCCFSCVGDDKEDFPAIINVSGDNIVLIDQTSQFNASYIEAGETISNVPFTWTSSNPSVATIDNNGLLTSLSAGKTQIVAKGYNSNSFSYDVEVVLGSVNILASKNSITENDTLQLSAIYDELGTTIGGKTFTWSTNNSSIATVNSNGILTGVSKGIAKIVANTDGVDSDSLIVNIVADSSALSTITLTSDELPSPILKGSQIQFNAQASNLKGEEISTSFVWKVTPSSSATISSSGLLTATAAGTVSVVAETTDGMVMSQPYLVAIDIDRTKAGQWQTIDYTTEGDVSLVLAEDNSTLEIKFGSNYNSPITPNLPGAVMYLANSLNFADIVGTGIEIGVVNTGSGTATFTVPTDNPLGVFNAYNQVVLVCKPFKIVYAKATLN